MATATDRTNDTDFTLDPDSVESDPATWPEWTDADCWVPTDPGPDDTDMAWAARAFNAGAEDLDELAALEAAAQHVGGLGLIPLDLAEGLARSSLVGLADRILHEGSDPSWCGCYQCVEARTRHYGE